MRRVGHLWNPWRLFVMRHPALTDADRAAFDALLARTAEGGEAEYDLPQPRWWFLHHLVTHGYVLHGSNERAGGLSLQGADAGAPPGSDAAQRLAPQPAAA